MLAKIYLTETEAAAYLTEVGVKREAKTLRKQRTLGGGIPFVRFGRDIRYRKQDIDAWLNAAPVMTSTSDRRGGK